MIDSILGKAAPIGVTAVLVIDPRGRILAASEVQRTGRKVTPDFLAHLAPVLKGQSAFVRPYRVAGAPTIGRAWVVAPVRAGDGKVVAALALGSPADKGFAALFARRARASAAKPWPSMPRAGCCRPAAMPRNCAGAAAAAAGLPAATPKH
jgi:hypothetical protein